MILENFLSDTDTNSEGIWIACRKKDCNTRIGDVLLEAEISGDEKVAWHYLLLTREFLCAIPASDNIYPSYTPNHYEYLEDLNEFVDCLDKGLFCTACCVISTIISCGCISNRGVRDAILNLLFKHKNLQGYFPNTTLNQEREKNVS